MSLHLVRWGSLSYLLVGGCVAICRCLVWAFVDRGPPIAAVFDVWHILAVSWAAAGLAELLRRLPSRRRWIAPLAIVLLSQVLALAFLGEDVDGFSRRQRFVPRDLAYYGTASLLSLSLPLAAAVGRFLDRTRLRWIALGGSIVVVFANGVVLPSDYWGIHLFAEAAALACGGRAFESALGRPESIRPVPAFIASLLLVLPVLVIPPPPRASVALAHSTGAAFSRLFGWKGARKPPAVPLVSESEWLESRRNHPPITPTSEPALEQDPIIILLTVDALRADVVYSRAHDAQLTSLARLRDEGVVFTQARAGGTLTKTSLASLFLGIHFSQQYWSPMENRNGTLTVHADESVRFTELLSRANVHTTNVRSINWLRNGVVMRGFDRDIYVKYPKEKSYYTPSPPLFARLLPLVKKSLSKARPAFFYSHLSDPHAPYDQGKLKKGSAFDRYLSEVQLVDSNLGQLLQILDESDRKESILLILSADHGEAFGEHRSKTHGTTMYDEGLHVPLIFWRPQGTHRTIEDLVSLLDLGPTILDLFRLPTPGHYMGQSLVPYLNGDDPALTRPIIAETRLIRTLVTEERLKLIVDVRSGRTELYDLKKDPEEEANLSDNAKLLKVPLATMDRFFQVHTLKKKGYKPPFVK